MENNIALVVGKKNREIYQFRDNDLFTNLCNGRSGKLKPEDSQKLFSIPVTLNKFANENPKILDLISALSLSLEPNL